MKVYNRALAAHEIRDLYRQKDLMVHLEFDDASTADSSIHANDATINGAGTSYGASVDAGTAFAFDGVNGSYLTIDHDDSIDTATGSFTVM